MNELEHRADGWYRNGIGPCVTMTEAMFLDDDTSIQEWS